MRLVYAVTEGTSTLLWASSVQTPPTNQHLRYYAVVKHRTVRYVTVACDQNRIEHAEAKYRIDLLVFCVFNEVQARPQSAALCMAVYLSLRLSVYE